MSDRSRTQSWLGRLVGRAGDEHLPPWRNVSGQSVQATALEALLRTATLEAEAICCGPDVPLHAPESRNVFGVRVATRCPGSAADTVVFAGGMALAGLRVSAVTPFSAGLSSRIRGLADQRTPLVVCVIVQGEDDLDALAGTGIPVAVCQDGAHAVDLALVARRLAESAITPVVVALEPETAREVGTWLLPPEGLVRDLLGSPSDAIEPPTQAQKMLFGESRRRVPRWFDPDRPVLLGAAMPEELRASAEAGRWLYFDADLMAHLDAAGAAFTRFTGREIPAVVLAGTAGSRTVLVAEGRAAAEASRAPSDAAVVGITWRSPFPEDPLRRALARAERVTVLVRPPLRGADTPALARAVRGALPSAAAAPGVAVSGRYDAATVAALLSRQIAPSEGLLWAVPAGVATASSSPRRESLLQRLRRDVPASGSALVTAVSTGSADAPPVESFSSSPPLAVRRMGKLGSTYENVARFWGESAEPLAHREPAAFAPDPYLALGAVPPYTAAFLPSTPRPTMIPVLDPERCTACGNCWTSCPDAAIPVVAGGTAAFLEAAARPGAAANESAAGAQARLRRSFKPVAQKADDILSKAGARRLDSGTLREAWSWYAHRGIADPAEREALGAAFEQIALRVDEFPLVRSDELAPDEKSPAGVLLLGFDPRACRGCGICAAECPERAIAMLPRTPEREESARRTVEFWEEVPDTPGPVVHRAEENPRLGPLAAALLTRHAAFAVVGGGEGEAGSGTRLAARQALAVVEAERQKATVVRIEHLTRLEEALRAAVREALADAVNPTDLTKLDDALRGASAKNAPTADLLARMEQAGERPAVDTQRMQRLASAAIEVGALRRVLREGEYGTGRARFGLVVVPAGLPWASHYPANPFGAPAMVASAATASTAALGLIETLVARAVDEARIVRRARLVLEHPSDDPTRQRDIEALAWSALDDDEATACAPVLVLAARSGIHASSLDDMLGTLACDLPVKIVLLDDGPPMAPGGDPVLPALARRRGHVVSTSVAHAAHLAEAVATAVRARVPALVRVLAPSPDEAHGLAADATVSRARDAVGARVAPLVRYDPTAGESFRSRLSLAGNPEPGSLWAADDTGQPRTPGRLAPGGGDAEALDREVAGRWNTLREWAGIATETATPPAVEVKVVEVPVPTPSLNAAWLRQRLLELAGYSKGDRS